MTQIITNNSGGGGTSVTVVDDLNTQSSTSALSANQGYVLKGMIDDLMAQGRFLSLWNCATGQPISFPMSTPYTYSTGDYFMVETLDENDPATNYRPNGSSYTGTASSTVETGEVAVGDYYVYDGAVWLLASNHGKTVSFANLAGQPTDNVPLGTALGGKQNVWIEVNVATANGTAAKVGTTTAGNYTPTKGDFLLVNFVNGCSVDNPTLKIDGGSAIAIRTGSAAANKSTFALGTTANSNIKALMYYDGTYYRVWSTSNTNTTYSTMSVSEGQTGTATSARTVRADYLKSIIKYHAVDNTRLSDDRYSKTNIAPSQASIYYEFDKRDIQAGTDLEIIGISSHNLPDGYTELAYLGGSGSGYIDTGNILNCRDSIKIKFKRTANTYSSVMSWFGSIQGSSSIPRYGIGVRTSGNFFTGANSTTDIAQTDMNVHTLEMGYDNGYFYKWDGGAKTTYTPGSETNPTANAYLFARNGSTITYSGGVRIYYLEWKRNDGTDVAHLIPAQRDSDGVLGMYDLISETFLAPSGSGTWAGSPLGNVINFTNDSGYITNSELPTKAQLLVTSLSSGDAQADIDEGKLTSGTLVTITLDDAFTGALNNIDIDGMNTIAVIPRGIAIRDGMMGIFTVSSENGEELYIIPNSDNVDLSGYQTTANLKTSLSDNSDSYYPSQKAVKTAVDGKQDKATSGNTAPSTTPTYVGQQYVDTTNDKLYVATGTSSSSDWKEVGSGGGGGDVTGPASSTDGNVVLFDGATGKIIKDSGIALSSKADATDVNTKTFYLASSSDLTTAQAIYDWHHSGKEAIVVAQSAANHRLLFDRSTINGEYIWQCFTGVQENDSGGGKILGKLYSASLTVSSGVVTSISIANGNTQSGFLNKDNTAAFTPTSNYNPATKKYVDDGDTVVSGDSGTTYTIKVSNTAPASGTPNTTITFVTD